LAEMRYVW
jgi:hypothetical protein